MIRYCIAFILLNLIQVTTLEAQANKDSLWQVFHDASLPDTNRLKAIQALTWPMLTINLDSALLLANMQLDLAQELKNEKWIARAYYNMGARYFYKSDYPNARKYYDLSLEIRKRIGDKKGEAAIYGNIGLIYGQQGNSLKDLEYQLKSLAINETLRDTDNLTSNYSNLAGIYHGHADTTNALRYYQKALDMYFAQNRKQRIGLVYNNMGNLYRDHGNYEKAKYYLLQSLAIRKEHQDPLGTGITLLNLSTLYNTIQQFDTARMYAIESIEHFNRLGDEVSLANVYYNLGETSRRESKYREAISWCTQALAISERVKKLQLQAGSCYCLYLAHKDLGEYAQAMKYLEDFRVVNDTINNHELQMELNRLEFEKEILTDSISRVKEMSAIQTIHQKEIQQRNWFIIIAIGIGLVLALGLLSRMLLFQRRSAGLQRKTQELETQKLINEISLLRTQVNPHFLFNSLSILSSLVHIDPQLSEKFIDQLARSYRYILEQKDETLVLLRTELNFIESYAFLLKIRFEKKFNLQLNIPEEALDHYRIAPLTLQLLVENAVKHNRMSVSEPLIVYVSIDHDRMLVVRNKLQLRTTGYISTGIGLQNIKDRYAILSDRAVSSGEENGDFIVKVPLI